MEGQITQWQKDIKGAIRRCKWKAVPPFTASDCPFGIVWSLCYLSLHLQLLIAPLISFGHCVICPSIYNFWLPLWYLLIIVLSVPPFTASDCPFDIFWSLCYLSLHLQLLIAPSISFDHCVICPSIYSFWLPLWYLLIIVLSVPPFMEGQISQWSKDIKGPIRSCKWRDK
jgi:hypothetical protein